MPLLILALFIGIPLLEIAVFIQVGDVIGLWPTLATVVLTAVLGVSLLKRQGLSVLGKAQKSLDRGEMPLRQVFDGACLLIAGALLLTPGFVTDTVGFLLLVPAVRDGLVETFGRYVTVHHTGAPGAGLRRGPDGGPVIDGEAEDVTPPDPELPGDGPADGNRPRRR